MTPTQKDARRREEKLLDAILDVAPFDNQIDGEGMDAEILQFLPNPAENLIERARRISDELYADLRAELAKERRKAGY